MNVDGLYSWAYFSAFIEEINLFGNSQILNKNLFKCKIKHFKNIASIIAQDKKFVNKN